MTPEEQKIELDRCKNGFEDMTGEEYFFYNYCKIDGKAPTRDSYTREKFKEYQKMVEDRKNLYALKQRRPGIKPPYWMVNNFIKEHPLTPEQAFKIEET